MIRIPRRWRFTLRTLLVGVFLLCAVLAEIAHLNRVDRRQREAEAALAKVGASVGYNSGFLDMIEYYRRGGPKPRRSRLREAIDDYFERHWPELQSIDGRDSNLGDVDLAQLRGLKHVKELLLPNTRITDAGLVHLQHLPTLRWLDLSGTAITDHGLAYLSSVPTVEILDLSRTRITDAGLAALSGLEQLEVLVLDGTNITGEGFRALSNLRHLSHLNVNNTQLNDVGVASLQVLPCTLDVRVENTPATDAALEAIRRKATAMRIRGTDVIFCNMTYDEVEREREWRAESNYWRIRGVRDESAPNYILRKWISFVDFYDPTWDYSTGVSSPSSSPIPPRLSTALRDDTREVLDASPISLTDSVRSQLSQLRRVRWLRLPQDTTVKDLQWIGQLTQLRGLSLEWSDMKGADFGAISNLQSLEWLNLSHTGMSGNDFETLPLLPSLQTLVVMGPEATDQYLAHLADLRLPALTTLLLCEGSITDAGLTELCDTYNLEYLSLTCCTGITAKSADTVGRMSHLFWIEARGTGALDEELSRLQCLLPRCGFSY